MLSGWLRPFRRHVVVIDEAHNLINSLLSLHSTKITLSTLSTLRSALMTYLTKFRTRLNGSNAVYLKQLLVVLKGLASYAEEWLKPASGDGPGKKQEVMVGVNEFVRGLKGGAIDQINLLKLDTYLKVSKMANKVCPQSLMRRSVAQFTPTASRLVAMSTVLRRRPPRRVGAVILGRYYPADPNAPGRQAVRSNATRQLHSFQTFLVSLTNAETEGRVLLTAEPNLKLGGKVDVTLTYMLLAPSNSFRDIAEESRSVILAGGTMKPVSSQV